VHLARQPNPKEFIMNNTKLLPVMLAIATLLGACTSMPRSTGLLEQTRTDYRSAQGNPAIAKHAPLEIKQAGDALAQADAASADRDSAEKIDKLAYLAKQKIALAQEMATKKSAEADVASAGKERDQMRLDQRTSEADRATARAEQANAATQIAQSETAAAQVKTQEAQNRAAQLEAQLAAQLADLAAKKTERGMVITLGDVLFGTDLARLSPDGMRTAQKLADVMQKNPQRTVLIEGFTDSTGGAAHNQELSERRATAVRSALQELGVGRDRVAVRGYGASYPVAANDTTSNRQLNRRVEIIFSDADGKIMQR
jgi:outer membrane protein OmpA-like peptidoglycan-associated protein